MKYRTRVNREDNDTPFKKNVIQFKTDTVS